VGEGASPDKRQQLRRNTLAQAPDSCAAEPGRLKCNRLKLKPDL
jgi:hypothetical protein